MVHGSEFANNPGQQYEKYSENYNQINDCQHDVFGNTW